MQDLDKAIIDVFQNITKEMQNQNISEESMLGVFYVKEHIKNGYTLSKDGKEILESIILELKNDDIKFLILKYLINLILNPLAKKNYEKEFFSLYYKIDDFQEILANKTYIELIFPSNELNSYLKYFYNEIENDKVFWDRPLYEKQKIIFSFHVMTLSIFDRNEKHFKEMFKYLYKIFIRAIELDDEEMIFYLYTPLQYSWNAVSISVEDYKYFNDNVEKILEKYIQDKIINRYNLLPVDISYSKNKVKKVALLLERVIDYSIFKVVYSLLRMLKKSNNLKYEFIILDLNYQLYGGSREKAVEKIKSLGFEYIDCHKYTINAIGPFFSYIEKCLNLRELIIKKNIDILIGFNMQPEYNFLFTTRTAPKQIYWSHGNSEYDIKGIDKKVSHFNQKSNNNKFDFFSVIGDYSVSKQEKFSYVEQSEIVRNVFPKDFVILGSIGRLIKIDNKEYLDTVLKILKENPKTVYIACGDGDTSNIEQFIKNNSIEERFLLAGFVNIQVYGRVIDIYLNTFPEPGGESVNEFVSLDENKYVVSLTD